jgi:hypothetical protein
MKIATDLNLEYSIKASEQSTIASYEKLSNLLEIQDFDTNIFTLKEVDFPKLPTICEEDSQNSKNPFMK